MSISRVSYQGSGSASLRRSDSSRSDFSQVLDFSKSRYSKVPDIVVPKSMVKIDHVPEEMQKEGFTNAVTILGEDNISDEITDISAEFHFLAEDVIETTFSAVLLKVDSNHGAAKIKITTLGKITKALGSLGYPFVKIHRAAFMWIPLFDCIEGTKTTIAIEDTRHCPPLKICSVEIDNSIMAYGELYMGYHVSKDDEEFIVPTFDTPIKPIAKGQYGVLIIKFEKHKTKQPSLIDTPVAKIMYLERGQMQKNVSAKTAFLAAKEKGNQKIAEMREKQFLKEKEMKEGRKVAVNVEQAGASSASVNMVKLYKPEMIKGTSIDEKDFWIIDSGATDHCLHCSNDGEESVTVICNNGTYDEETRLAYLQISHKPKIIITDVILSSKFIYNILSESKLFSDQIVSRIENLGSKKLLYSNDKIVMTAQLHDGLYKVFL